MKKKNKLPPPIFWIVLGIVLIWQGSKIVSQVTNRVNGNKPTVFAQTNTEDSRFSDGDRLLISEKNSPLKRDGIEAYRRGDYQLASQKFEQSLQTDRNDPEALIDLHNIKAREHNPLKLAVVVPIGSSINIAQEMLRGVAQGQQEINQQGGINGRYLHITIVNDSNDPNQSKEVAEKLVKDSDIIAVIGHNASNASLAAAPIYQQGKLVMINPTSFSSTIPDIGDYVFRTVSNVKYLANSLSEYAKSHHKKIAICYDETTPDGISFKDEFTASWLEKGGQLASTVCNLAQPTFNPQEEIAEAVNSGADGLLVMPHIDRLKQAYELAKANQGKLPLLGNSTLYTIKTLEAGNFIQNLTVSIPWYPNANYPFAASARRLWGGDVTWRTAGAYDATNALVEGLKQSQTREGLQQALASPSFVAKTPNGDVKFQANGDRLGQGIIAQLKPSKSHTTGYEFAPVNGSK